MGPEGWISRQGPDGRLYWHQLALGPAPWDEKAEDQYLPRYLPEVIDGKRLFENQRDGTYRNIVEKPVFYRVSPNMDDRDDKLKARAPRPGEVVRGEAADGWVKVMVCVP